MLPTAGSAFDAAPFGAPLTDDCGVVWEDPRELHRVVVRFAAPPPADLALQYWRGKWPAVRLPKDQVPAGGAVGWWELGDWFNGQWQTADAETVVAGTSAVFTFRPANAVEFPELGDFAPTYRTALKLRLAPADYPAVEAIVADTDSTWERVVVTVLLAAPAAAPPSFEAFNGQVEAVTAVAEDRFVVALWRTANPDPNSWDRTLLSVRGDEMVTVRVDDLGAGPLCVPDLGVAVVAGETTADYAGVCARAMVGAPRGLYDAVAGLPEQTWRRAWANMVPKRRRLYLPLAPDGGRHKFALNPDGSVLYRTRVELLTGCPGRESTRLAADCDQLTVAFGLPAEPVTRTLQEGVLPIGISVWRAGGEEAGAGGVEIEQVAYATVLGGTDPAGPEPAADETAVVMSRFELRNRGTVAASARLALSFSSHGAAETVSCDEQGLVRAGELLRASVDTRGRGALHPQEGALGYEVSLEPGDHHAVTVRLPYVGLVGDELAALPVLDFDVEREAVAAYWRRRIGEGMRLTTPEPALNEFHAAVTPHLLINCELEPGGGRRFARVGSLGYAAFGNESCMMIVDLDRRGLHRQARECLAAFLHYQGTVGLPGDFSSHEGVLYGAHGYEHGGYNQHHGWILWSLIEHYRFTRDRPWLASVAGGVVAAADWIIRERARTLARTDIGRGLFPHGSLEDIGDWWQWLSTNAYTWRGLDAAAWGLEQLAAADGAWAGEASRLRQEADDFRTSVVAAFRSAAARSPVVRLRDGTCVPHFPSHVHRRGRSFGWICETLEGALHLVIAGLIPATSREALWIIRDYEDNLYLSEQYGYATADFARHWFDHGGFSMQACLLLDVEPYLARDDIPHALRALFNGVAANYYPDSRMLAEHALPRLGEWKGDHYKTSDEANAAGWLRYLFVREQDDELLLGQAVPREWLATVGTIGVERAATYFGELCLSYEVTPTAVIARLQGPWRNPPARIRLRFRLPRRLVAGEVLVNGVPWAERDGEWVLLPGDIGTAEVRVAVSAPA